MTTRVPLIIHVPELSMNNIVIEEQVELVDLFPTLVDLTQVSQPLKTCRRNDGKQKLCTDGRSSVPLMNRYIFNENNVSIVELSLI